MSRILITGGAGFIGYFLAERLSSDGRNRVTIVDNLLRGRMDDDLARLLERDNVEFVEGDLTDPGFLIQIDADFDYIYHLAAVIGVKNVMKNPDRVLYVNAVSTLNLFEYARDIKSLKRILFSSTSEIYAGTLRHFGIEVPTPETVPLALDDISSKRTTYALSKMYGEAICFSYGEKFDIPFTIVRYHNVYGPRMGFAHVIPEMFVKVLSGKEIDVPSPKHTRAFCYIDDAVEYTIRACESSGARGEILHVGNSSEEIRIEDVVNTVAGVLGKDIKIIRKPDTPGSTARRCPDITKIRRITGYEPKTGLREGIEKTYDWYRDRLNERHE